ncbi:MAG: TetR/AcrR family transcriptional regulator [Actinomycetota bacterium]
MAGASAPWGGRGAAARERTRQALLDTALRLFAERGYIGVRVEDIAKEAGVSRATFYKHFAERDEILASLFDRLLGSTSAEVPAGDGSVEERVGALLDATAARMLAQDALARFVYSIPIRHDAVLPGGAAAPAVFSQVRALLEAAVDDGELRGDVAAERVLEVLGRAFEAAMRDWSQGQVDDPRTRLHELLDIAFRGAATPDR